MGVKNIVFIYLSLGRRVLMVMTTAAATIATMTTMRTIPMADPSDENCVAISGCCAAPISSASPAVLPRVMEMEKVSGAAVVSL